MYVIKNHPCIYILFCLHIFYASIYISNLISGRLWWVENTTKEILSFMRCCWYNSKVQAVADYDKTHIGYMQRSCMKENLRKLCKRDIHEYGGMTIIQILFYSLHRHNFCLWLSEGIPLLYQVSYVGVIKSVECTQCIHVSFWFQWAFSLLKIGCIGCICVNFILHVDLDKYFC